MMPFKEVTFRVACIKNTLKNKKAIKTYLPVGQTGTKESTKPN